ncbi:methionyl-tRNA formyltransferase [Maribrevibacterium harenarium]|uniref:Methionyl-tRNA formyltransferase n=1 Tax=Maribrevibacterium harenarium TaxID=2589817 RepID=A0A501X445_9GAMM|nr:methionyl-tRNA formyltransferase [Maribrevibacterium harenarium]TPE55254.1 methionyl-tRNA formyltransferase [Maribrevibacterium harenarium]
MSAPLKIIFAGTPEFAAASLQALLDQRQEKRYEIVAVYTQPDRPAGRGQKLVPSPVKQLALDHGLTVKQPLNFKEEADRAELASFNADIMIVAAYGLILPKAVLETPRLGCINVHASLLPRWRGAAPIHRALLAGDVQTGITIMQMDVGLDTGDMILKHTCDIKPSDTSASLHDRLAPLGGAALIAALDQIQAGTHTAEAQDNNLANYAHKLTKEEGNIDWTQPAAQIERQIRGLCPWPSAYTQTGAGVMKIHAASLVNDNDQSAPAGQVVLVSKEGVGIATGDGTLLITEVQFPGGKRIYVRDALNGKYQQTLGLGVMLGESV